MDRQCEIDKRGRVRLEDKRFKISFGKVVRKREIGEIKTTKVETER